MFDKIPQPTPEASVQQRRETFFRFLTAETESSVPRFKRMAKEWIDLNLEGEKQHQALQYMEQGQPFYIKSENSADRDSDIIFFTGQDDAAQISRPVFQFYHELLQEDLIEQVPAEMERLQIEALLEEGLEFARIEDY